MKNIRTMECLDGFTRADATNIGPVVAKTASYTIKEFEQVGAFSNKGAAGAVTFTLPKPLNGRVLRFMKGTPGQNVVLQATNNAKINNGTVNKKYQNVTSEAGTVTIVADGVDWFVLDEKGTWAVDNS